MHKTAYTTQGRLYIHCIYKQQIYYLVMYLQSVDCLSVYVFVCHCSCWNQISLQCKPELRGVMTFAACERIALKYVCMCPTVCNKCTLCNEKQSNQYATLLCDRKVCISCATVALHNSICVVNMCIHNESVKRDSPLLAADVNDVVDFMCHSLILNNSQCILSLLSVFLSLAISCLLIYHRRELKHVILLYYPS